MRIRHLISILIIILIFGFIFIGCKDNSDRINELERRITDLQSQLTEKEKRIQELENSTTATAVVTPSETTAVDDEKLVEETINSYMAAVEDQNFIEQKKYVIKYALDLVNFKEEEYKISSVKNRQFDKQPVNNIQINGNKAEAFMSFTEHLTANDNSKYDLVTEGKVFLEKINNEWKIYDYTRKNRLISEAMFKFENLKANKSGIEITINHAFFSLLDKYIVVGISIFNGTSKNLKYYSSNSILVGFDKKQTKAHYYDENLEDILPDSIASGEIQFDWNYDSNNNFAVHTGNIDDENGYTYLNDIKVDVDLSKSIRY